MGQYEAQTNAFLLVILDQPIEQNARVPRCLRPKERATRGDEMRRVSSSRISGTAQLASNVCSRADMPAVAEHSALSSNETLAAQCAVRENRRRDTSESACNR